MATGEDVDAAGVVRKAEEAGLTLDDPAEKVADAVSPWSSEGPIRPMNSFPIRFCAMSSAGNMWPQIGTRIG